jgi:hypothetical protein
VLSPNTCATFQLLRLFQILNCLGKPSAYDFLRGLERCTNNDGLDKPPVSKTVGCDRTVITNVLNQDCRKLFMHIVQQWREVKRMKHGKWGHKKGEMKGMKQGELMLKCRTCPQPGLNLPEDWEQTETVYWCVSNTVMGSVC